MKINIGKNQIMHKIYFFYITIKYKFLDNSLPLCIINYSHKCSVVIYELFFLKTILIFSFLTCNLKFAVVEDEHQTLRYYKYKEEKKMRVELTICI
jgi:hypothetical protein